MKKYLDTDELWNCRPRMPRGMNDKWVQGFNFCLQKFSERLRKQIDYPTTEVVGVKEARWKGAGMGDYYCSLCGSVYSGGDEYNFCPNCGAKMKDVIADA